MHQDYPRDLAGYGETPPDPRWPGHAKIAVQFVVNYEEGGENCLLHGDPHSEAFLSEIAGAEPWHGERHWNMESIYEYGARVGFWRLHRLFAGMDIPVTVFGVATALARSPEQVAAMKSADWEIASHGLKWIDYRNFSERDERAHIEDAISIHETATGGRPAGWYTGRCSMNTFNLISEIGGFEYVADSYADELPYWRTHQGTSQLIVPYTLDANDMRFATAQGFNCGEQFFAYLKDTFDVLYEEGAQGSPKMMSVGLHCRLVGRPDASQLCADSSTTPGHIPTFGSPAGLISPGIGATHIHQLASANFIQTKEYDGRGAEPWLADFRSAARAMVRSHLQQTSSAAAG